MKKNLLFSIMALMLIAFISPTKVNAQNSDILNVEAIYKIGIDIIDDTIQISGIIDHVCVHTWKKFKIVDKVGGDFIKIELGEQFSKIDTTIIGKKVWVYGILQAVKMDAEMVLNWEEKMKMSHKGEEDTEHYKEELAFIQEIHRQIVDGEIPFYPVYSVQAIEYKLL